EYNRSWFPWLAVPITRAPAATASWQYRNPTAPAAALTNTVSAGPGFSTCRDATAVCPGVDRDPATAQDNPSGLRASWAAGTAKCSRSEPKPHPRTSSPIDTGVTSAYDAPSATRVTTPAKSVPMPRGNGMGTDAFPDLALLSNGLS